VTHNCLRLGNVELPNRPPNKDPRFADQSCLVAQCLRNAFLSFGRITIYLGQLRRRWVDGIGPKSLVRVGDYTTEWIAAGLLATWIPFKNRRRRLRLPTLPHRSGNLQSWFAGLA